MLFVVTSSFTKDPEEVLLAKEVELVLHVLKLGGSAPARGLAWDARNGLWNASISGRTMPITVSRAQSL